MLDKLKRLFSAAKREEALREHLEKVKERIPAPLIWLLGKTQSGKTSLIRYLTGASEAEIGQGFRPCTRFSRIYHFPTPEAPLILFLDTRGVDEPGYDPGEDLARFDAQAHLVLVTVKALDHAQHNILTPLERIRRARPQRPVLLTPTCLHEAYPQQQHPLPYPFDLLDRPDSYTPEVVELPATVPPVSEGLLRSLAVQCKAFGPLVDRVVPVDLTPADEGFQDPTYGGPQLRQAIQELLPATLAQTLYQLDQATHVLSSWYAQRALPLILGYSTLAMTAGAVPVFGIDMVLLSGIQTRMILELGKLYDQPMTGRRFLELGSALGLGLLARQAGRSLLKLIPFIGSFLGAVTGGALAASTTYALGMAFSRYCQDVHQGHIPPPSTLKKWYREELARAQRLWSNVDEGQVPPSGRTGP